MSRIYELHRESLILGILSKIWLPPIPGINKMLFILEKCLSAHRHSSAPSCKRPKRSIKMSFR